MRVPALILVTVRVIVRVPVRMMMRVRMAAVLVRSRVVGPAAGGDALAALTRIDDLEVGRGNAGANDRRHPQLMIDSQRPERFAKPVGGKAGVEERAEQHVAGGARETVEIHHLRHQSRPASLIE
jgi:hypothetical protein